MKNEVKDVVEKESFYEVFVDSDNDYPFMSNKWERNEFYGGTDKSWDKQTGAEHLTNEKKEQSPGINYGPWQFLKNKIRNRRCYLRTKKENDHTLGLL